MNLLLANSEVAARALERRAFAFVIANQDANGGGWSKIFTDGARFAILWAAALNGAFTDEETGKTLGAGNALGEERFTFANVIDADPLAWSDVPDPSPAEGAP